VRVLAQSAANGVQRVIIRFNRVLGRIYAILIDSYRPDESQSDQLATNGGINLPKENQIALQIDQFNGSEEASSQPFLSVVPADAELARVRALREPPTQS